MMIYQPFFTASVILQYDLFNQRQAMLKVARAWPWVFLFFFCWQIPVLVEIAKLTI